MKIYQIEYFNTEDYKVFAWVYAASRDEAVKKIGLHESFSELVQVIEHELFAINEWTCEGVIIR